MVDKFEEGKMYKHKRMHDTAVRIMWAKEKDEVVEVMVMWYNSMYRSFIDEEIFEIKKSELNNWMLYTPN